MKILIILSFLFICQNIMFAQQKDLLKSRIKEIKSSYAEIQEIGLNNCKNTSYVVYENNYTTQEKIPFTQTIKNCSVNDIYTVKTGQFNGDHWYSNVSIYYKNGYIFFIFEEGGGEGQKYETRYYCDSEERIIQELHSESEGSTDLNSPQIEIKENLRKHINQIIDLKPFNKI